MKFYAIDFPKWFSTLEKLHDREQISLEYNRRRCTVYNEKRQLVKC